MLSLRNFLCPLDHLKESVLPFNLFANLSYREIVSTWEQSSDWAPASEMATARPRYHILNDRDIDVLLNYIYRIKRQACFCSNSQ